VVRRELQQALSQTEAEAALIKTQSATEITRCSAELAQYKTESEKLGELLADSEKQLDQVQRAAQEHEEKMKSQELQFQTLTKECECLNVQLAEKARDELLRIREFDVLHSAKLLLESQIQEQRMTSRKEMQSLQQSLGDQLNETTAHLEQEKQAKNELESKQRQVIEELQGEVAQLTLELEEFKVALEKANEAMTQGKQQRKKAVEKAVEEALERAESERKKDEEVRTRKHNEEVQKLEEEKLKLSAQVQNAESALEQALESGKRTVEEVRNQAKEEKKAALEAAADEAVKTLKTAVDAETTTLKKQANLLNLTNTRLQHDVAHLKLQKQAHEAEAEVVKAELVAAKSRCEAENKKKEADLQNAEKKIHEMEHTMDQMQDKIHQMEEELHGADDAEFYKGKLDAAERRLLELKEKLETAENGLESAEAELAEVKRDRDDAELDMTEAECKHKKIVEELQKEAEQRRDVFEAQLNKERDNITRLNDAMTKLKEKLKAESDKKSDNPDAARQIQDLHALTHRYEHMVDDLQKHQDTLLFEKGALEKQVNDLKKQKATCEEKIREFEKEKNTLQEEWELERELIHLEKAELIRKQAEMEGTLDRKIAELEELNNKGVRETKKCESSSIGGIAHAPQTAESSKNGNFNPNQVIQVSEAINAQVERLVKFRETKIKLDFERQAQIVLDKEKSSTEKLEKTTADAQRLQQQKDSLAKKIEMLERMRSVELQGSIDLKRELAGVQAKLANLKHQNANETQKLERWKASYRSLKEEVVPMQREVENLKQAQMVASRHLELSKKEAQEQLTKALTEERENGATQLHDQKARFDEQWAEKLAEVERLTRDCVRTPKLELELKNISEQLDNERIEADRLRQLLEQAQLELHQCRTSSPDSSECTQNAEEEMAEEDKNMRNQGLRKSTIGTNEKSTIHDKQNDINELVHSSKAYNEVCEALHAAQRAYDDVCETFHASQQEFQQSRLLLKAAHEKSAAEQQRVFEDSMRTLNRKHVADKEQWRQDTEKNLKQLQGKINEIEAERDTLRIYERRNEAMRGMTLVKTIAAEGNNSKGNIASADSSPKANPLGMNGLEELHAEISKREELQKQNRKLLRQVAKLEGAATNPVQLKQHFREETPPEETPSQTEDCRQQQEEAAAISAPAAHSSHADWQKSRMEDKMGEDHARLAELVVAEVFNENSTFTLGENQSANENVASSSESETESGAEDQLIAPSFGPNHRGKIF